MTEIPMQRFIVRYTDGRRVEFTAYNPTIALDWAFTQGIVSSWFSWMDAAGATTAPVWS